MKTEEYIKSLIKERDELKTLCKSHVETIRLIKRELVKLNHNMSKKDKQISELENGKIDVSLQTEFNTVKDELNDLTKKYEELLQKYEKLQSDNKSLNRKNTDLQNKFNKLNRKTEDLQLKYVSVSKQNEEYKSILDGIETICESEIEEVKNN